MTASKKIEKIEAELNVLLRAESEASTLAMYGFSGCALDGQAMGKWYGREELARLAPLIKAKKSELLALR